MKSAIIGLGVIGKVHYDVLKSQDADIVALCDVDESALDKFDGVKSIPIIKRCWIARISTSCIFAHRIICMRTW